jgi:hypothetical protein
MEPQIDTVHFGKIAVAGKTIKHDVIISHDGQVRKRKKRLSKEIYGTSHTISLAEAKATWEEGTEMLIIGSGHFGRVRLSLEAQEYLAQKRCAVELLPTKKAAELWNKSQGKIIGVFHITC